MGLFSLFSRKSSKKTARPVARYVSTKPIPTARRTKQRPDPIYDDTGELSIDDRKHDDRDNPYDTASWTIDPEKGLRRVDDDKTVNKNRGKGDPNDPYNTGVFRKGW